MPTQTGFFSANPHADRGAADRSDRQHLRGRARARRAVALLGAGAVHVGGYPRLRAAPTRTAARSSTRSSTATCRSPSSTSRSRASSTRSSASGCSAATTRRSRRCAPTPAASAATARGTAPLPPGPTTGRPARARKNGDAAIVERILRGRRDAAEERRRRAADHAARICPAAISRHRRERQPHRRRPDQRGLDRLHRTRRDQPAAAAEGVQRQSGRVHVRARPTTRTGITVPTSALSTTSSASGTGGLNLSVDGGAPTTDTLAIDHEACQRQPARSGHTTRGPATSTCPPRTRTRSRFQQSPTLPTTLNCPQTGSSTRRRRPDADDLQPVHAANAHRRTRRRTRSRSRSTARS